MKIFSLANKLILFISIFIFALVIPLSGYFYFKLKKSIEDQTHNYLTSIAEFAEGQVFLFFDKVRIRTADWSSDGTVRQITEKLVKEYNRADAEYLSEYLAEKKMPIDPTIKLIDIVSPEMTIIASSEPKRIGMSEHEHVSPFKGEILKAKFGQVFIESLKEEEGEEDEYHPSGLLMHSAVPIKALVPIRSMDGDETVGILLIHLSGDILNKIISGEWQVEQGAKTGQEFTQRHETGEIYLVNENRLMITPSRFVENSVLRQKVNTVPVKKCFDENEEFSGNYIDYRGVSVQGASMCFTNYKIALIAEVDEEEVFAALTKERKDFFGVTILLWVLGVLTSILFSRILLRNIKVIRDVAVEVSKGNIGVRAEVESKDESGELAKIFNKMLDDIGKSKEELSEINKKLQEANRQIEKEKVSLETKVHERTKELEDIKNNLELLVREKTMELEKRVKDLEKFRKLTIGRELRMIELKKELANIKK